MENSDRKISVTRLSHKHLWHNLYIYFSLVNTDITQPSHNFCEFSLWALEMQFNFQTLSLALLPWKPRTPVLLERVCYSVCIRSIGGLNYLVIFSGEETNKQIYGLTVLKTRNSRSRFQRVLKLYFLLIYNTSLFLGLPNFDSPLI